MHSRTQTSLQHFLLTDHVTICTCTHARMLVTLTPKLHKLVIVTNFLCWTVLMLHIQFLHRVLHSRLLTHPLLISSKLLSPCRAMAITYFLILVYLYTHLLQQNILSCGSEFVMLGSCMWQKSCLFPCEISLGAHFCQLTTPY
jgi:hypothetical protein